MVQLVMVSAYNNNTHYMCAAHNHAYTSACPKLSWCYLYWCQYATTYHCSCCHLGCVCMYVCVCFLVGFFLLWVFLNGTPIKATFSSILLHLHITSMSESDSHGVSHLQTEVDIWKLIKLGNTCWFWIMCEKVHMTKATHGDLYLPWILAQYH